MGRVGLYFRTLQRKATLGPNNKDPHSPGDQPLAKEAGSN